MTRSAQLSIALLVAGVAACKKGDDKPAPGPTPGSTAPAPTASAPVDAAPAPPKNVPRDPRIAELFAAGTNCTWNDSGLASCDAGTKMEKLAFENQGDDTLAASCMGALRDPAMTTRGLAAVCMRGFNDRTRIPFLGAAMDAFEAEQDPKIRHAISWAFSNGNAREAGVEPRVIALVKKLVAAKDDDAAANFLDSMFPQYLMQSTDAPSKESGDLALELARNAGSHTQTRALEDVGLLTNRKADVCTALADAMKTERWSAAIETMTRFPAECAAPLAAAVDLLATKMTAGTYDEVMKRVLTHVVLTPDQVAKLKPASKKLVAKAETWQKDDAKALAKLLDPYTPPAPK